ncbi:MAG: ATP-binding protein [Lachnospiraceae bacterium]|nr:ATP-binding protein [Lachnospiraceae bacterium]
MGSKISRATAAMTLNSLKSGAVPRTGLEYITVGRKSEIQALLQDVSIIGKGGAALRFIEGKYGSGKTFLMHALRNHAMKKNFVVADVELSVDRRLVGNKGQGLATYRELVRNMATYACPDNGALQLILDNWIGRLENEVVQFEGLVPGYEVFDVRVSQKIYKITSSMEEQVNGFDFGKVLASYYKGHRIGDVELQKKALRWLCGEYRTRTEAKTDLGVNLIITDENWYDFIKLFADFLVKAGYAGFYVCMDELAALYEIPSRAGRDANYSKLLSIYNDVLQGKTSYMGMIFSVAKEAMEDPVRGIFSYEPLKSRLEEISYGQDRISPVIKLSTLNPGEMYVLLEKLADIHGILYGYTPRLEHDDYINFLKQQYGKSLEGEQTTIRELIKNYITLLNLIQQNQEMPKEKIFYIYKGCLNEVNYD